MILTTLHETIQCGLQLIITLRGDPERVTQDAFRLYNYGYISDLPEFRENEDSDVMFITSPYMLRKVARSEALRTPMREMGRRQGERMSVAVERRAAQIYEALRDQFVPSCANTSREGILLHGFDGLTSTWCREDFALERSAA